MKRWLFAVGAALAVTAPPAVAQTLDARPGYLVIRVILESGGNAFAAGGQQPGGLPGEGPGGFPGGPPGGIPGGPPGGVPGGPPGGFPGGAGPGAGSPDGGGPGGFGPGGFGPGGFGPGARGNTEVEAARSVVVVVPYTKFERMRFHPLQSGGPANPAWLTIATKYGRTYLFSDRSQVQFFNRIPGSLEKNVRDAHTKWSTNRTFDGGYDLVVHALGAGMVDEAYKYAKELLDLTKVRKDVKPPQKVLDFQKVFEEIGPKLDAPPAEADQADVWREKLGAAAVERSTHYALIYWGERQINPADIRRRLTMLEHNFKAFYLWQALNGVPVKLPPRALVTVLADRGTDMPRLRDALDGLPIVSDAFYSQVHDLVVISPERLDDNGRSFSNLVQAQYQLGWNREDLLRGKLPKTERTPNEVARVATLALVDKALEEEADHAAISREATRQLYIASGILPQNVQLPQWLESGLGSFFHKPKGPLFTRGQGGVVMTVGLAAGYGSPNYEMHRLYKDFVAKRELPAPEVLLKNVLADRYFDAIADGKDIDPTPGANQSASAGGGPGAGGPPAPGGRGGRGGPPGAAGGPPGGEIGGTPPGETSPGVEGGGPGGGPNPNEDPVGARRRAKEKLEHKAHGYAWALTYYLNRSNRMPGLQKFYAELRRIPRDMRIGDQAVLLTFARCFNLMNADGTGVDEEAFKQLAIDWVQYMNNVPTYGLDMRLDSTVADPSAGGGQGGFPGGGFPGGGLPGEGGPGGLPGGGFPGGPGGPGGRPGGRG